MPVRYLDEDEDFPTPRDSPADAGTKASHPGRRLVLIVVAMLAAAAVIITVTWSLTVRSMTPPAPTEGAAPPAGEPSGGPSGDPATTGLEGDDIPPYTAGVEAVPGLWVGLATVTTGNQDALYGIPTGWPKTAEGAVGAAMNYDAAMASLPYYVDDTGEKLNERLFTPEGRKEEAFTAGNREYMRQEYNLTKDGEVLETDGTVSGEQKFYAAAYPWYGAYKIEHVNDQVDEARIVVWQPFVFGPGTDDNLSEVYINWTRTTLTMRWSDGDWRIAVLDSEALREFQPADGSFTNQSFQARREAIGEDGWMVPADATQDPRPGSALTKN